MEKYSAIYEPQFAQSSGYKFIDIQQNSELWDFLAQNTYYSHTSEFFTQNISNLLLTSKVENDFFI